MVAKNWSKILSIGLWTKSNLGTISGGFGGGSGFGGGGGGGVASSGGVLGRRGFRLLAVGGIATAIALGASDDD